MRCFCIAFEIHPLKKVLAILRFLGYGLLLGMFALLCAFYTHPSYMKQKSSEFFPELKEASLPFPKETPCTDFEPTAPKLNDRYRDYIWNSAYQKFGDVIVHKNEIRPLYLQKKLFLVDSNDNLAIDTLFHSFAFLTADAKNLLNDLAATFQEKIKNTKLSGTKIIVTSLLRTVSTVKRLKRVNRNSLRISSHLHGTTFDIAHDEFQAKDSLNPTQISYLREILAKTLYEFRLKKRCFVTYEINQACFHVVNRNDKLGGSGLGIRNF